MLLEIRESNLNSTREREKKEKTAFNSALFTKCFHWKEVSRFEEESPLPPFVTQSNTVSHHPV